MKKRCFIFFLSAIIVSLALSPELIARVVSVTAGVDTTSWNGRCPKRFNFIGKISVNKPGVVKYKWIRSDGAIAPVKTLIFRRRGVRTVSTYWILSAPGTHWQAIKIISPNSKVSNRAVFTLRCLATLLVKPKINKPGHIKPVIIKKCPDPAAVQIRFDIVSRYSQFKGRIRITGIVKNIGEKEFISGPNQAKAYLYQLPPGVPPAQATGGIVVAQKEIRNLAQGAILKLTWERDWNSASPSEGEFPNSYRLLISLDPDIYKDANKNNDDCNQGNNKKDRSGEDINNLLR